METWILAKICLYYIYQEKTGRVGLSGIYNAEIAASRALTISARGRLGVPCSGR